MSERHRKVAYYPGCALEGTGHAYNTSTKAVGKGQGLGLAVTYDIIKKHDGVIEVQSELGKGTEFTVKLFLWQDK